jgi:hypothetical protein
VCVDVCWGSVCAAVHVVVVLKLFQYIATLCRCVELRLASGRRPCPREGLASLALMV